jgi:FkbM family methyltransferase
MFISYSQNFEDVLLWRALKNVKNGFYVDVGANDPEIDSVTKLFYDHGWKGINVEPVNEWFVKLVTARPRDVNLKVAASSEDGEKILYEIPNTGLSTAIDSIAQQHKKNKFESLSKIVKTRTLTKICLEYAPPDIHFLKIDVEGAEEAVLQGLNLEVIRPWIILIESTMPLSQKENYQKWEKLITGCNYEFCYFDGLNRYYVAFERKRLKKHFIAPPNVFDNFSLSGLASNTFCKNLQEKYFLIEGRENDLQTKLNESLEKAHHWWVEATKIETQIPNLQKQLTQAQVQTTYWQNQAEGLHSDLERRSAELTEQLTQAQVQTTYWQNQAEGLHSDLERRSAELTEQLTQKDIYIDIVNELLSNSNQRYDKAYAESVQLQGGVDNLTNDLNEALNKAHYWWLAAGNLESEKISIQNDLTNQINVAEQSSAYVLSLKEHVVAQAELIKYWELKAHEFHKGLIDIHASKSWRITSPMRGISKAFKGDFSPIKKVLRFLYKKIFHYPKQILKHFVSMLLNHQEMIQKINIFLALRMPKVRQYLVGYIRGLDVEYKPSKKQYINSSNITTDVDEIYSDICNAIKEHEGTQK